MDNMKRLILSEEWIEKFLDAVDALRRDAGRNICTDVERRQLRDQIRGQAPIVRGM